MAITGKKKCIYLVADANPQNIYRGATLQSGSSVAPLPVESPKPGMGSSLQVYVEEVPFDPELWRSTLYPQIQNFLSQLLEPAYAQYQASGGPKRRIELPSS
jgi:hypothetical protein